MHRASRRSLTSDPPAEPAGAPTAEHRAALARGLAANALNVAAFPGGIAAP